MIKLSMAIFLSFFLILNFILSITKSSLCHMQGCEVATSILKINNSFLYGSGFLFSMLLAYLIYKEIGQDKKNNTGVIGSAILFKNKKETKYTDALKVLLSVALVFETTMLSFLIISTGAVCVVCLTTFITITILYILTFSWDKAILIILPVVIALSLLETKKTEHLDFENKKYILIQSESCSHCIKTKKFLKDQNIEYKKLDVNKGDSILKEFGIKTIPVLLEKKDSGFSITTGENNIKKLFEKDVTTTFINPTIPVILEDGCNLEKPICNDK